jgi:molybdopterin converting factor small subunit
LPTVTVRLPGVLAQVVGGTRRIDVEADNIGQALAALTARQPALAWHIYDEHGALRRHVRCFCNDEYASEREGLETPLNSGDTITLMNSVAGG